MSSFKRSQAKYVKQTHKIMNWSVYDQSLVSRGSLTFWFTDDAISKWTTPPSGKAGGQRKYSDLAIETTLAFQGRRPGDCRLSLVPCTKALRRLIRVEPAAARRGPGPPGDLGFEVTRKLT